eukprot:GGOE01001495.1.p1 GENE.GGOE01001495.1~~GGOE01001495.1.p1  ORF type:complete len:485 (+),score=51.51 GGOE01001495.1:43-1497(+)
MTVSSLSSCSSEEDVFNNLKAKDELKEIGCLAFPVVLSYLIEFGLPTISLMAAGRLGVQELDGLALGTMTANITGASLVAGLATAMDTLASQAYGARNLERVGVLAQRAICVCLLSCVPIAFLWWNIEPLLLTLGQEPENCRLAALYLRVLCLYLIPFTFFEVIKKYISVQGIVTPITCIMLVACVFHGFATYMLIWPCGLGFIGSPLALVLSFSLMAVLGVLYVAYWHRLSPYAAGPDPRCCWGGLSMAAFDDWSLFLKLGLGGSAQLCFEWWAFEVLVALSGVMGSTSLAATTIALQMSTVAYNFPLGVSIAASIRVGQHLGANSGKRARRSALVAVALSFVLASSAGLLVFLIRHFWVALFTSDKHVAGMAMKIMTLVAFNGVFDGIHAPCGGILRGAGLQMHGALINFVGLWVIGLPLGAGLAFAGWGVYGLYVGFLFGLAGLALGQTIVVCSIDWNKQARRARSRAASEDSASLLPRPI